ncbi:MAG: thioredoxin family protein [Gemmatimonadota bacterium]
MIDLTSRSRFLPGTLLAIMLVAGSAVAQEAPPPEPFTPERFAALQEEDALILLDVWADWCPVCAQQQEILARYRETRPDVPLHTLVIDFDDQKEYVREFDAPRQSTLILYQGEERIWFSVAELRDDVIFAALDAAARTSPR